MKVFMVKLLERGRTFSGEGSELVAWGKAGPG